MAEALAEFAGLGAKLLVGQRLERRLERADLRDNRTQTLQIAFVLSADDLGEERLDHLRRGRPRGYPVIVADVTAALCGARPEGRAYESSQWRST